MSLDRVKAERLFSGRNDYSIEHDRAQHEFAREAQRGARPTPANITPIREGLFDFGFDPDQNHTADQVGPNFSRKLTSSRRDLSSVTQERSIEIAWWLSETNPLAKRGLALQRDFILGDGLAVHANAQDETTRKQIQACIDAFWRDPINLLDIKGPEHVRELATYGEYIPTVAINRVDGGVKLGYIDPQQVLDMVMAGPESDEIIAVQLKGDRGEPGRRYRAVHLDEDPLSDSFGRYMGAETDSFGNITESYINSAQESRRYDGSCLLFQINKMTNSRRGRSDLLAVADWIDAYDQLIWGELDRHLNLGAHLWDVTVAGEHDDTFLDEYAAKNSNPKPGSLRVHNESVTWQSITPGLKAEEGTAQADLQLSYVATGLGFPKHWLNGSMDVNRAAAGEMSEPAIKSLTFRQNYIRYMFQLMVTFALDQYELKGRLEKRPQELVTRRPAPWDFTLTLPEIRARDFPAVSQTVQQTASAVIQAVAAGLLDNDTAQRVMAMLVQQFGVEVDLTMMRVNIEKETAEREAKAQQQLQDQMAMRPPQASGNGPASGKTGPAKGNSPMNKAPKAPELSRKPIRASLRDDRMEIISLADSEALWAEREVALAGVD